MSRRAVNAADVPPPDSRNYLYPSSRERLTAEGQRSTCGGATGVERAQHEGRFVIDSNANGYSRRARTARIAHIGNADGVRRWSGFCIPPAGGTFVVASNPACSTRSRRARHSVIVAARPSTHPQ